MRSLSAFVPASWEQTILDHAESLVVAGCLGSSHSRHEEEAGSWWIGVLCHMGHFLGSPTAGFHAGGACPEAEPQAASQFKADYHQFLGVTPGRSGLPAGREARGHAEVLKVLSELCQSF